MTDRLISEAAVRGLIDLKINAIKDRLERRDHDREQLITSNAALGALLVLRDHLKFIETAKETQ